jgi:NAD(P)-dependent dehydrogenase (short-subunit alcohol dehydrogenase family)
MQPQPGAQVQDMKTVVITGSTRGIGYGLADSFLALGCQVTVSGRSPETVEQARATLSAKHGGRGVHGHACDVAEYEQVQALWDAAQAEFRQIDIWINNAGMAHTQTAFWDHSPVEIRTVVDANVIGAMHGGKVALRGMRKQGFGALYNVEGLGSNGRRVDGLTLYGSTKSSLRYLTDAWAQEVKGTDIIVGALSPGMVVTRLLTQQYEERSKEWERARRVFNILADRVETVTPWLAERVLTNNKNGSRFTWLGRGRVMLRFLAAPFRKRDLFSDAT